MAAGAQKLSSWKKAGVHKDITLRTGTVVDITLPNLPKMIQGGLIPNNLLESALSLQKQVQGGAEITIDMLKEQWPYTRWLIAQTVVDPVVTEADVDDLPVQDTEMLVEFATRTRDLDAVGHHLSGLERVETFRELRGLPGSVAGASG